MLKVTYTFHCDLCHIETLATFEHDARILPPLPVAPEGWQWFEPPLSGRIAYLCPNHLLNIFPLTKDDHGTSE